MRAAIDGDIKEFGAESRFAKIGKGQFMLNSRLNAGASCSHAQHLPGLIQENSSLSFTDCAEKVLSEYGEKKPMRYRDIVNKAIGMGWSNTAGQTLEATMRSKISSEIQRKKQQGRMSRFQRLGHGMIGSTVWQTSGLE